MLTIRCHGCRRLVSLDLQHAARERTKVRLIQKLKLEICPNGYHFVYQENMLVKELANPLLISNFSAATHV